MPTAPLDAQEPQAQASTPASPASLSSSSEESIRVEAAGGEAGAASPGALEADREGGEWQIVGEKRQSKPAAPTSSNRPAAPAHQQAAGDEAAADDSDSDEDSDDEAGEELEIQLGFAEPLEPDVAKRLLFLNPNWHDWDGGKIGGKPIWLNPRELPAREALDCASCQEPLSFILQIYCPLDDPAGAFHRALYVFCCRKPRCTGPGCAKVFRCQLPRDNPFYAHEPKKDKAPDRAVLAAKTCDVCGQGADKTCAGCKKAGYCSRAHQKEAWKAGHKFECSGGAEKGEEGFLEGMTGGMGHPGGQLRSVLPEYEIVIEEDASPGDGDGRSAEERKKEDEALLQKYQDVYVADAGDEDAKVGQRDLDQAAGANPALKDKQSLRFLAVIGREPDQVLRYARWQDGAPLWVATEGQARKGNGDVPPCPHCGAARAFEFQVMPQLLHYLRVDAAAQLPNKPGEACKLGAMDWGTLAAYTCTKSCDAPGGGYVEEVVWRQQPMA